MKRNLKFERFYPYPPDAVWQAIADPRALSEWMMETDFQPYVGHRFKFRTDPAPGFDGIVNCEVIAVEKPRRLAYTWQGGWMKAPTTVTWTLMPQDNGTLLRLEHNGFEGVGGIALSFILGTGWKRMLRSDKLEAIIRREMADSQPS
jgi:uncharacterized protein YndB with AHSA1/START domain